MGKKKIGILALVLTLASSVCVGYAEDNDNAAEVFASDAAVFAANDEENPDETVVFEFGGESEDELGRIKMSNTDVTITHDPNYVASGTGALFVEVKGAYGSMQFPFDLETGKLYKITYKANAPAESGETWLQRNIYAKPAGAHQGAAKLTNETFTSGSKVIYYPDTEYNDATFGFYCNDAGKKFVLDDVKMVRYDDFGISKKSAFYDGIKDVDTYSSIFITFNYEVDKNSIDSVSIEDKNGNQVSVRSCELMSDKKTLIVEPDLLDNNKDYVLKFKSVSDTVGRKAENVEVNFTTVKDVTVSNLGFDSDKLKAGEISLKGTIKNNSFEEKNVVVKMWLYHDMFMIDRISVPVTVSMMGTVDLSSQKINVPELSDGTYSLAASVWEDDFDIRPITKSVWLEQ